MPREFKRKDRYNMDDLLAIMEILRGENGCPWDREQDHHSIRKNFLEETYEVLEAIDNEDPKLLREELGDVLLQVVLDVYKRQPHGSSPEGDAPKVEWRSEWPDPGGYLPACGIYHLSLIHI